MLKPNVKTKSNKFSLFSIFLLALASAMMLSACGGQSDTQAVQPTVDAAQPTGEAVSSNTAVSFSKDIKPILDKSCVSCHGGERTNKGLDVTTYDKLMVGSVNGAVIVPNNADGSKLVVSVAEGKMPKRGAKLTTEQVQLIKDWVNAGAENN
jgi:hypothetical protein